MNARDRDLFTASRVENSGTPEDRARAVRIRAREAQAIARDRKAREPRTERGRTR